MDNRQKKDLDDIDDLQKYMELSLNTKT